jgi:hypothetical protein
MGKKCIPGLFCIENMTLFLLIVVFILLLYLWHTQITKPMQEQSKVIVVNAGPGTDSMGLASMATRNNPFTDPYAPPLKSDGIYYPPDFGDLRGLPVKVPINIESRGLNTGYQQVGILTRSNRSSHSDDNMILPLMGRRNMAGRDKWQYYTISNTGNLNTKLPISVNGKSCTSEYGCDQVYNGDSVYVEGYKDIFNATVYENNLFRYLPY